MPTTYEKCDATVEQITRDVIAKYHPDLAEAGVTVSLLFARDPESDAPVRLHGYACAAKIRATSLKDRAKGNPDAEIVIDEREWIDLSDAERFALIDHELYHLEVKLDDRNKIERDDLNRPKLRMRLHDAQIGIFRAIINRHGMDALDAQIAKRFIDDYSGSVLTAMIGSGKDDGAAPDES
jgi:hypothetical protein